MENWFFAVPECHGDLLQGSKAARNHILLVNTEKWSGFSVLYCRKGPLRALPAQKPPPKRSRSVLPTLESMSRRLQGNMLRSSSATSECHRSAEVPEQSSRYVPAFDKRQCLP